MSPDDPAPSPRRLACGMVLSARPRRRLRAVTEDDLRHLRRCLELATLALEVGDEPFGSVLVSAGGEVLFEDHNHVASGDHTRHPEFAIARWAAENLPPDERAATTV